MENKDYKFLDEDRIQITTNVCINTEQYLYFASDYYNALFRIEKKRLFEEKEDNQGLEFVGVFPNEIHGKRLWSDGRLIGKYLVFVPLQAENIALYDLVEERFISIPLQEVGAENAGYTKDAKFSMCLIVNNKMIFLPYTYPHIIVLDIEKKEICYSKKAVSYLNSIKGKSGAYFVDTIDGVNIRTVNIWSQLAGGMVCFNVKKLEIEKFYKIDGKYESVVYDNAICLDDEVWLIPRNSEEAVLRWNYKKNRYVELNIGEIVGKYDYSLHKPIKTKRKIYIFPKLAEHAFSIDVNDNNISVLAKLDEFFIDSTTWKTRFAGWVDNMLCVCVSCCMFFLKKDSLENDVDFFVQLYFCDVNHNNQKELTKFYVQHSELWSGRNICSESGNIKLENWLDILQEGYKSSFYDINKYDLVGGKILKEILGE